MNNDQDLPKDMPYMSPLTKREDASREKGYTDDYDVESSTTMVNSSTKQSYSPDEVTFVNFYRFEGMSDPGDNTILYEVETNDGRKGLLITPYGPDCPAHVADFVASVDQIAKQHAGSADNIVP